MGIVFKSYRQHSKKDWGRDMSENEPLNAEQITVGCLLRIADASEAMAKNHNELIRDLNWARGDRDRWRQICEEMERSNRSLKGQITKMKKKLLNNQNP